MEMTSENIPSPQELQRIEPEQSKTVNRRDDQGFELQIDLITEAAVDGTEARTYTDNFGHYFVGLDCEANSVLDSLVNTYTTENSVLCNFQRSPEQTYELTATLDNSVDEKKYEFRRSNSIRLAVPADSEYSEYLDRVLELLEEDIRQSASPR